jgi:hypothetical protein
MSKIYAETKNGRTVEIGTRVVGQHFGCEGVVKHGRKVVARTGVKPYGFEAAAIDAAKSLAATLTLDWQTDKVV